MNALSLSLEELIVTFLAILVSDFVRYLIGAGGVFLLINLFMSHSLRHRKIRSTTPAVRQMAREFLFSLRTVLIFACVGTTIWIGDRLGLLLLYRQPNLYGWGWFVASVIILIVLHDCWFYWMHWILHRSKPFRRFHVHHHRSHNPSPFTAYSFSVGEAVLTALYFPLVLATVPVSEFAAFLFTAHMMLVNAVHHCGYEIFPSNRNGTPLLDWLTTTTHHDLHHADGRWNFGFYFTHWDRWMGTEHPQYHEIFSQASAGTNHFKTTSCGRRQRPSRLWMLGVILAGTLIAATFHAPRASAAAIEESAQMRSITGTWASEGYAFVVRFGPCIDSRVHLCGTLQWAWDRDDITREAWHRPMLRGFIFRDGYWRDGELVHPHNDQIFRGKLRQDDKDTLYLQGCVAMLFCDDQIWHRLNSLPHITSKR